MTPRYRGNGRRDVTAKTLTGSFEINRLEALEW